ncbi:MAG: L-aspartate oxidase [Oscillospiraceae bacterium]|nr:L-aspartate oxidase [Oscillospiraceae bacterium]
MRFATNRFTDETQHIQYDVVVIGAGIAGLYTALHIDDRHSCCILTKEDAEISNSWLAQGGIAAAISLDDAPAYHFEDTIIAGAGLCDENAVRVLVSEGPLDIRSLVEMQVPFDLDNEGDLDITREGGHRRRRIVHAGGDATGRETVKALAHLVSLKQNVTFMPHNFCADILTDDNGAVSGCAVLDKTDTLYIIDTPNIVLATGGIGQVYRISTNPSVATGDGLAAAVRAGAKLKDMEFIQFHPTGLWSDKQENRAFLISESVRGEGGLLKNSKGERFMLGQHELNELAPRDIVARAITRELMRSGETHAFIDITSEPREYLEHRFPTIFHECMRRGFDISKSWIPVCPVQHYLIGGIQTDLDARTRVEGLYACGEAASTGVHGANRLASNSMLECLVFGRRAAANINGRLAEMGKIHEAKLPADDNRPVEERDFTALRSEIQQLMNDFGSVLRNEKGMSFALTRISEISAELESSYYPGREYIETLNIADLAVDILEAALARKESVGAHYRED